jgi:DNA polymerase
MTEPVLHLDFETYSTLNLKDVGVENYLLAPDATVTAVAWAFDNMPVRSRRWPDATPALPQDIVDHIARGGVVRAWNAAFEWAVLTYFYGMVVEFEQMDCSMQRALAYGLPAALEDAGKALDAPVKKDDTFRRKMLAMGKPRKDGSSWHADPRPAAQAMLVDLEIYCRTDVAAERSAEGMIPRLHIFEKAVSVIDARINAKGVMIDMVAVEGLLKASLLEKDRINRECSLLTGGAVQSPGTETAKLMTWLAGRGTNYIPDMTKETVATLLTGVLGLPPDVRRVLELRQEAAKASPSKLARMEDWASHRDGRARHILQFYGAGRTGRWAGRGIQVQNLPRKPKEFDAGMAIAVAVEEPQALGLFHPRPLDAIKWSLRGCLIAKPGHRLVSIDLSQIEARVLAWLAGQKDVLDAFRRGDDVYVLQAAKVGSKDRQLGKVLTLACGYGMGKDKFRETAGEQYGVVLTAREAANAVADWRAANGAIVGYWHEVARAVHESISHPGLVVHVKGGIQMRTSPGLSSGPWGSGRITQIRKPNTVKLTYHNMHWTDEEGLVFQGVDSKTKQWGRQRTYGGKLVENIVQSVARDVLAEALLRIGGGKGFRHGFAADGWGVCPVMTVHDDIVWEIDETTAETMALDLQQAVDTAPAWAAGLPLASEVKISRRYGG